MKSIVTFLEAKNIKPHTIHHTYEYLYASFLLIAEEYADQWKYDFSKPCRCNDSPGETWCCNLCGLPIDNKSIGKKRDEKEILEAVEGMCIQSLSPDVFEKWEEVKKWLITNRKISSAAVAPPCP